nr:hypothetical protein [Tanacetum cinerariifolium]
QDVSNNEENKAEENKADAEVAKKQARNVQTSLTLSSFKLKTQSMVDVPIHQEDLAVQRTLLIDTDISMVTEKQHQHPHHQPHKLKFKCVRPLARKICQEKLRMLCWWKEHKDGQTIVTEDNMTSSYLKVALKASKVRPQPFRPQPYRYQRKSVSCSLSVRVGSGKLSWPVKNKREKDKIGSKLDQIKKKGEAWRSPEKSKAVSVKENPKKDKIESKPDKREAWRNREKSKAVTVDRGRKTEENAKRRAKFANSYKVKNKREKDKIGSKPDQIKKKQEAWRSPEKSKAVSVGRARKTEQNTKRRAQNAHTVK